MRAAGPAPAPTRPALANGASSRLESLSDRVLWLAAPAVLGAQRTDILDAARVAEAMAGVRSAVPEKLLRVLRRLL